MSIKGMGMGMSSGMHDRQEMQQRLVMTPQVRMHIPTEALAKQEKLLISLRDGGATKEK